MKGSGGFRWRSVKGPAEGVGLQGSVWGSAFVGSGLGSGLGSGR